MKYFAVIDTNVIVSAALALNKNSEDSSPYVVLGKVLSGEIVPLFSEEIIKEYTEVLSRKKFALTSEFVDKLIHSIKQRGIDTGKADINEILPDPKDAVFYQVTLEGQKSQETYLVTGNLKHFPQKPFIVSPRQMIDIILKDEADALFKDVNRNLGSSLER